MPTYDNVPMGEIRALLRKDETLTKSEHKSYNAGSNSASGY